MERTKLLVVDSNSDVLVHNALAQNGYDVSFASTPEDTMLSVMEIEPEAVIWSETLDHLSEWQRVKAILEARKPLLSVSREWSKTNSAGLEGNGAEEAIDLQAPVDSFPALLARLENLSPGRSESRHFYTKVGNKLRRIDLGEIRYIQVEGKYSAIQLESRQYHVKASLKDLLLILQSTDFVRVSRNFVVNLNHIEHIDMYQCSVHVSGEDVPVSRTYKENLMKNVRLL